MLDSVNLILSQQFLVRALVVGVLISLCCALLGVSLVLKRFSMIGDGLSHVGFGAMAIACAANVAPLYFSLPIVLASAFLLLRMNEKGKIKGDAAIALISTGALAVGVMVTSMTTGMNVDIYNYMFGSILTMSNEDVLITSVVSIVILALFVLFYNEIFAVTFDESFAQATGTKTSVYNFLIAGLTAVIIVIGMRMMGALLISSLIIFPTVTSMRFFKSFRSVVVSSAVISVFCFLVGLVFSVEFESPTGASVVIINIYALLFLTLAGKIRSVLKTAVLRNVLLCILAVVFVFSPVMLFTFSNAGFASKERLSIVTTGFAQYDLAKNIAGEMGEVEMLLSPGEESHTYEPTPADVVKISECDIFIYGGGESEAWADSMLKGIGTEVIVVKMMEVTEVCSVEHEHSHEEHQEIHEEYDEHVWTSPVKAMDIAKAICESLCEADEENESYFRANTEMVLRQLDELDQKFRLLGEKSVGKCVVIGDRFPLRYLMLEYGFGFEAAFPGCSAQVEVNPVRIAELNDKIIKESIPVVFKVDLSTGTVAHTISEATGADVDTLYSCHIVSQSDFENGEGYISLMNKNYEALSRALS